MRGNEDIELEVTTMDILDALEFKVYFRGVYLGEQRIHERFPLLDPMFMIQLRLSGIYFACDEEGFLDFVRIPRDVSRKIIQELVFKLEASGLPTGIDPKRFRVYGSGIRSQEELINKHGDLVRNALKRELGWG
jgi:hypothetical protein